MKKLFLIAGSLVISGCLQAQVSLTGLTGPEMQPVSCNVTQATGTTETPQQSAPKGAIPETIIGKRYVTFYDSFTNYGKCAGNFTIEQGTGDTVILKGIANGMDLKGIYNKTLGIVTVPTGQSMGEYLTYGELVIYTFLAPGYTQFSMDTPCVLTFTDNKVNFNHGFYGKVTAGGIVSMRAITGIEANGSMKFDQYNSAGALVKAFDYPVYFKQADDTKMVVQGLAAWLYRHNYDVPFTISGSEATLLTTDSIDWYKSSTAVQSFFMLKHTSSGVSPNPTFSVTKNIISVKLTANSNIFEGYQTSSTNWSGFFIRNMELTYDIPGVELPTEATVDQINYSLDNTKFEAKATGCDATLTALNIPNTITVNGIEYKVVAVGKSAFQAKTAITSASMPKNLKVVETDAFRNMSKLRELKIEDLASWCDVFFANGNANPIYNIFPTSTSQWGKIYINGQQVSTAVTVPEGVTRLSRTFYGFKSLTSVSLPNSLKVLGDQTFANCTSLLGCEIPAGVDSIGSAFFGCSKITSIDVPRGVQNLGASTFYGCSALNNVTLHTGLKLIRSMVFSSCSALTKLSLPSTLDSITPGAFMSTSMTELTCKAVTPPATTDITFSDIAANCILFVPEASIAAYKAAPGWKAFVNIQKMTDAAAALDADTDMPACYYDLNGFRMDADNLKRGIYIKVQGNKTEKVMVK